MAFTARMLIILALACGLPAAANCQTYRNGPFDPATTSLPPGYYGYDPAAFVEGAREEAAKEQQARTKGEFETTAQYHERLSKMGSSNPFATNTYAFGVKPTAVSYDADKQTFSLRFTPGEATANVNYLEATIKTVVKDAGHYQAQNAFGAVFTVQRSSISTYELWLVKAKGLQGCTATAAVPLADAKSMNADIRALAVVKPLAPYESTDSQFSQPTFGNPTEITTVTGSIFGKLIKVRFYDWVTGQVLASCP